jgi:hypothetical protein
MTRGQSPGSQVKEANAEAGVMCGRLLARALLVQRTAAASPPRKPITE